MPLIGVSVKPTASGGYTCRVPLDLLSEDGTPPAEGDSVSYQVDGTVTAVDAEDATIKITAVNGQPVNESASEEAGEDTGAPTPPSGAGGPISPGTSALGAALRKGARGRPMPF